MLVSSKRVSDLMSPSSIFCVLGLIGPWPATKTKPPATTASGVRPQRFGKLWRGDDLLIRSGHLRHSTGQEHQQ